MTSGNMNCTHPRHRVIFTQGFTGAIGARNWNPAAHGCVTLLVECDYCGSRRLENHNGAHEEVGLWGPSAAAMSRRLGDMRDRLPPVPPPTTFRRGDRRATVSCDKDGLLTVVGADDEAEHLCALYPHLDEALARRNAVAELKREQRWLEQRR